MRVADQIAGFLECEVPGAARDVLCLSLFDWSVVALAARDGDIARAMRAVALEDGGVARASLIGGAARVPPRAAALVNGTIGHALDFDDTHFAHIGHVSTVVLPAVLAVAEGRAGVDVVGAAVKGAEASIRVGQWLGRSHYAAGFHMTATAGVFGAVVGAAAVMGVSHAVLGRAVALAASRASGVKAQFGTAAKPYHAGMAAAAGIEVLAAARHGIGAAPEALDGPFGLSAMLHGEGEAAAFAAPGWLFPSISHKLYACCHGTHAAIEAVLPFQGREVTLVEIAVHPRWLDVCNVAVPRTGLEAKFSYRAVVAMALSGLPLTLDAAFDPAAYDRADVRALRDKIQVRGDAGLADTAARVLVQGPWGEEEVSHDLAAPQPYDQRAQKLWSKAQALVGEALARRLRQVIVDGPSVDLDALAAIYRETV